MDNKEYNIEINNILKDYNAVKAAGSNKVIEALEEAKNSVVKLASMMDSKISNYKINIEFFLSIEIVAGEVTEKSTLFSSSDFANSPIQLAIVVLPLPLRP